MKVCVLGLWHLGSVTAACAASLGHQVAAYDPDPAVVAALAEGRVPVAEPGLEKLVREELDRGRLRALRDAAEAVAGASVVWVTFDTPVDEDDVADVGAVLDEVRAILPLLAPGTTVLLSSQLPVGSTAALEAGAPGVAFAYAPENLRLGKAIEVFLRPDRVVVGVRGDGPARDAISELLAPLDAPIEWMDIESAEMAKHAINAFLATSVTFINELASLCEAVGADARDVERALKSEARIGPRAYLGPGGAFAGGTLARDVRVLEDLGRERQLSTPLFSGVWASNEAHRGWARRALETMLRGNGQIASGAVLEGKTIAVWGLTYKPGTDTLRRSGSVELCRELVAAGAQVRAHDPAVGALPSELRGVALAADPLAAARGADALVVATEWPQYREVDADAAIATLRGAVVVDANSYLRATLGADERVRYATVGRVRP